MNTSFKYELIGAALGIVLAAGVIGYKVVKDKTTSDDNERLIVRARSIMDKLKVAQRASPAHFMSFSQLRVAIGMRVAVAHMSGHALTVELVELWEIEAAALLAQAA